MRDANIKVQARIGDVTSSLPPHHFLHLEVNDTVSGIRLFEMEITPEHLMDWVSGRLIEVDAYLSRSENIGKTRQTARVHVQGLTYHSTPQERRRLFTEAADQMSAETGLQWTPQDLDGPYNTHRARPEGYQVLLVAYVDPEEA